MLKTSPLQSLKRLFPPITQPLPLNERESRQLLQSLTSSFRRQLDKEHGNARDAVEASEKPASSPNRARENPVSEHLKTVLSNPLFTGQNASLRDARDAGVAPPDPSDVFDMAVRRGEMNIRRATGFLELSWRRALDSSAYSIDEAIRASRAGERVLGWLRFSGEERRGDFLGNRPFVTRLVHFLIAEGHEEVVWGWLAVLLARAENNAEQLSPAITMLLDMTARYTQHAQLGLDPGYARLLRATDTYKAEVWFSRLAAPSWRSLKRQSTAVALWGTPRPSVALFDAFVSVGRQLAAPPSLHLAHLLLHHPTSPDHAPAMSYLSEHFKSFRDWSTKESALTPETIPVVSLDEHVQRSTSKLRESSLVSMVIDTAYRLNHVGLSGEANKVLQWWDWKQHRLG